MYKLRHARYFYARMPWQQRPRPVARWEQHPPVPKGSPLLWKEMYLSGQTNRFVRSLSLVPGVVWRCVASVFTLVGWGAVVDQNDDVLQSMNQLILWGGGTLGGLMGLMDRGQRQFRFRDEPRVVHVWDPALNPVLAWSELTFRVGTEDDPYGRWRLRVGYVTSPLEVWPSLLGVGVYRGVAVGFYVAAGRRFEREGRA